MRSVVLRSDFDKALGYVSRAVSSRSLGSYQQFIKIAAKDNYIFLEATDDELYVKNRIEATIGEEGEFLVSPLICDLVSKMACDEIELTRDENKLMIKGGKSRYTLVCASATNFPTIQDYTEGTLIDATTGVLKDSLKKTAFCAYKGTGERASYYTSGVLLRFTPEFLDVVATDGHRLGVKKTKGTYAEEAFDVMVPASNADELLRFFPDNDDTPIKIYYTNSHIFLEFENFVVASSLLDVKFPDYTRVIPSERPTTVKVPRKETLEALRRAIIVSRAKQHNPVVRLRSDGNTFLIYTDATDVGSGEEDVTCETTGENMEIAINPAYLVDVLNQLACEQILIYWNSKVTPLVISANDDADFTYVVMPIRIE
jgi:DNA polymerase III subunit beta